jgi:hypothetical protein
MIRWKQAQVHEHRRNRQDKITILKLENSLSDRLRDILLLIRDLRPAQARTDKLQTLVQDALTWTLQFEKDVGTLVLTGRDPRWETPTPDPFVLKKIDLARSVQLILDAENTASPDPAASSSPAEVSKSNVKLPKKIMTGKTKNN